jgi:hypothetical protein
VEFEDKRSWTGRSDPRFERARFPHRQDRRSGARGGRGLRAYGGSSGGGVGADDFGLGGDDFGLGGDDYGLDFGFD